MTLRREPPACKLSTTRILHTMQRRDMLKTLGAVATASVVTPRDALARVFGATRSTGRLKQSVSRWCYQKIPLDDLCDAAKSIGYRSVELLDPNDWAAPKKHGLGSAMSNGFGTIPVGFNRKDNHDKP